MIDFKKMNSPWGEIEKKNWYESQEIQRSYQEVTSKIEGLGPIVDIEVYGNLSINPSKYPLYFLKSKNINPQKPNILITGGVHGYETSGVHGAIKFVKDELSNYSDDFNFYIAPCISPWGYETINRWNHLAIDPNRSFYDKSPAEECELLIKHLNKYKIEILAHFDLHETTDTDNSIFRPALESRDGKKQDLWDIPDGFYLVGDTENECFDFQKSIIESVRKVTHIAPNDSNGFIIGEKITQEGVINYPLKSLSLCAGLTTARFTTTTEVYPDSPKVTPDECSLAQVYAVIGGLQYLKSLK